jgi:NitT/TauT family transport system permease protein
MKKFGKILMMKSEEYKKYLKRIKRNNILVLLTQILIVVIFIVFWQIMADKNMVDTFLVSSPKKVLTSIIDLIKANNFWNHIFTTVYEIIISFILGNVIGLLVASILWFNKFLARVFEPFLTILNSLPKVALGPLIIIWAGANIKSIIIMSLLISAIISIINIYNAFKSTDENKIKIIKSMGGNKLKVFTYVVLRDNYLKIIESFKINVSMCFVGVIMGELLVSKEGIGYLIMYGSQVFNMNYVIMGVVLLVILTVMLYCIISYIEKISKK